MVEPIELEKSKVEKQPYIVWNAFVEMMTEDPLTLSDTQAAAHFPFWYDSEVQNGGHFQFFENTFNRYKDKEVLVIKTTLEALIIIGARKQAHVLTQAANQYYVTKRKHPSDVNEFVKLELENEFEKFDEEYNNCAPDINSYLEEHLKKYINEFVRLV